MTTTTADSPQLVLKPPRKVREPMSAHQLMLFGRWAEASFLADHHSVAGFAAFASKELKFRVTASAVSSWMKAEGLKLPEKTAPQSVPENDKQLQLDIAYLAAVLYQIAPDVERARVHEVMERRAYAASL